MRAEGGSKGDPAPNQEGKPGSGWFREERRAEPRSPQGGRVGQERVAAGGKPGDGTL